MPFVLDSSITAAWCFLDEQTPETDALLVELKLNSAFVPAIWPTEVSNTLLTAIRRNRISADVAYQFIAELSFTAITVEPVAPSMDALLYSAITHGLTVYDATYLDLALQRGIPLATKDNAMRAAAAKLGVALLP